MRFPGKCDDVSGYVVLALSTSRGKGHASPQASLFSLRLLLKSSKPLDLIITFCIVMGTQKHTCCQFIWS